MLQDRLSSLFPNRVAEEAISSTPAAITVPQVTVVVDPPSKTNGCGTIHADSRQILEAAHRSWAPPPSPHIVPNGYGRGFLRSSPSSTSFNRDDTGCHPPHSPVGPNGGSMLVGAPAASSQLRRLSGTLGASLALPDNAGPARNSI
ncbi:hypothetical protein BHE74_00010841 [Ensete ventricosum]|nr:hypothetical protein BHE74_00010841 [Ensete ventricosum]